MISSIPRLILSDEEDGGLWVDKLLSVSLELPFEKGEEAVAYAFLDSLSKAFPGYLFGIRYVSDYGERRVYGRILKSEPFTPPVGSRLFPDVPHEHVAWLGEEGGSTLHVGGEDAELNETDSEISRVLWRAAEVLRGAFEHVQVYTSRSSSEGRLRALESGMVQADKMASFGQLAAGIIHELNNPLTAIVSYTEYLLRKVGSQGESADPDVLERLQRIRESAQRLVHFTHDLVNYARPTRETPGPANLNEIIDKAVAFCDHLISESGAKVDRDFERGRARPSRANFHPLLPDERRRPRDGIGSLDRQRNCGKGWRYDSG
jgi:two-component system NtrC family sensor kinase